MEHPLDGELYVMSLDDVETVLDGRCRSNDTLLARHLSLDDRDFLVETTDVRTGTFVCPDLTESRRGTLYERLA